MEQEKTKGDPYTMAFIEKKGGVEEVARKTGLNRQTVRQVTKGRNAPGYEFITAMYATYPDYDLRVGSAKQKVLIASGSEPGGYTDFVEVNETTPQPAPSSPVNEAVIAEMRERIKALEKSNEALQNTNATLLSIVSKQFGVDMESVKSESATEVTQVDQDGQSAFTFGTLSEQRRAQRPIIYPDFRDARGINRTWN